MGGGDGDGVRQIGNRIREWVRWWAWMHRKLIPDFSREALHP